MEKLLKLKEVCELFQVSPSLVYKWVHFNFIPHLKIGAILRFRRSEIERWLKNKTKKGRLRQLIELS